MQQEGEGPCGDVKIEKAECINLVPEIRNNTQKRKTTNGIKRKQRQVRRMKEIGGKGKLTDFVTGKLQSYYAIEKRHLCILPTLLFLGREPATPTVLQHK